ncbi:MAG: adenylate cyclase [Rhodospirillaceae bacterium]|nr:adenylate cyclase [Rhodospirillaceae bacterium]
MVDSPNSNNNQISEIEAERQEAAEATRGMEEKTQTIERELKKLKLELQLRKNLAVELEKQKKLAAEANESAKEKARELDKLLKKQKLEVQLRKNLADEMQKQKEIAVSAEKMALEKKNEIESISKQLSKYLSPQIYHSIFSGEKKADIVSQRKKLTIFFSDIVGFTEITDTLEAEEISSMLNFYLTEMSQIALSHGGTIDKYVGDAILVFFGDPETKGVQQDAINCVDMAIAMQSKMRELRNEWGTKFGLREPLSIRCGIATGYCTVGNFGSADRLDYTVIGSQVNLAARLEAIAKPGSILISFDTHSQVSSEIQCAELDKVSVKGIREEVRTFEVLIEKKTGQNIEKIETNNIQLTANMDQIDLNDIKEIEGFLKKLKKNKRH